MKATCPNCNHIWSIPKAYGGYSIKCPRCKTDFQCPEPQSIAGYIVVCIVSAALAGVIGFGSGALLTRKSREETKATIAKIKAKAEQDLKDSKSQVQALQTELNTVKNYANRQIQVLKEEQNRVQNHEASTERYDTTSHKDAVDDDKSIMAQIIAHDFIKSQLKSPSTADFPWFAHRISRSEDERQVYKVVSHVDSQNSFGAEIRTQFWVELRYLGGDDYDSNNWEIISWSTY